MNDLCPRRGLQQALSLGPKSRSAYFEKIGIARGWLKIEDKDTDKKNSCLKKSVAIWLAACYKGAIADVSRCDKSIECSRQPSQCGT